MEEEILNYLSKNNNYVIWAGYAQFGHLGLKPSPDIDIYVDSEESLRQISSDFEQNGWKVTHQPKAIPALWDKLEKNGMTLDIVFSEPALVFFEYRVKIVIKEEEVFCISKEALFLTKLGVLTSKGRTEDKRKRDLSAILLLRDLIDPKKVREIVQKLPDYYWKRGWV